MNFMINFLFNRKNKVNLFLKTNRFNILDLRFNEKLTFMMISIKDTLLIQKSFINSREILIYMPKINIDGPEKLNRIQVAFAETGHIGKWLQLNYGKIQ